uniref:Uncharacterized protein n=1 Tax=Rhizophora mucronata TaxID=61149 RepID=A0A2P2IUH0_RHIMU
MKEATTAKGKMVLLMVFSSPIIVMAMTVIISTISSPWQ